MVSVVRELIFYKHINLIRDRLKLCNVILLYIAFQIQENAVLS